VTVTRDFSWASRSSISNDRIDRGIIGGIASIKRGGLRKGLLRGIRFVGNANFSNFAAPADCVHLRRTHRDFHAERPIGRVKETDMLAR
jgi:hypothetical protein